MKARIQRTRTGRSVNRKFPTNAEVVKAVRSVRKEVYREEYGKDGGN